MTAKLETFVPAAAPVVVPSPAPAPASANVVAQREVSQREEQARLARWKAIEEAGSQEAWVDAELKAKGL